MFFVNSIWQILVKQCMYILIFKSYIGFQFPSDLYIIILAYIFKFQKQKQYLKIFYILNASCVVQAAMLPEMTNQMTANYGLIVALVNLKMAISQRLSLKPKEKRYFA